MAILEFQVQGWTDKVNFFCMIGKKIHTDGRTHGHTQNQWPSLSSRFKAVGIPCANFAISLLILYSAAPNLAFHHYLGPITIGCKDFYFGEC